MPIQIQLRKKWQNIFKNILSLSILNIENGIKLCVCLLQQLASHYERGTILNAQPDLETDMPKDGINAFQKLGIIFEKKVLTLKTLCDILPLFDIKTKNTEE